MLYRLKFITFSFLLILLTGCAFVPESIPLQPQVNIPETNLGQGKTVFVAVIDARPDDTLGGRITGYGPAASIKLSNNITEIVREQIIKGLSQNGFKPVVNQLGIERKLTVRINSFDYKQRIGLLTGTLIIGCTLEGTVDNKGEHYINVYRAVTQNDIVLTPTSDYDTQHINEVFANSLYKLLSDKQLLKFLTK